MNDDKRRKRTAGSRRSPALTHPGQGSLKERQEVMNTAPGWTGLIGPEALPPGDYTLRIRFTCPTHGTSMGGLGARTVPVPFIYADRRPFMIPVGATGRLPEQRNEDGYVKHLFICERAFTVGDCAHHRLVSIVRAQEAIDALWAPWLRRVVTRPLG